MHGRHELPWRKTDDPYKILVSEVMLQQTQVDRVIGFYEAFIKAYPTLKKLAAAPLKDVLRAWQGLGYNRRAKMLHEAAKRAAAEFGGKLPGTVEGLESLSGVGPYTARAVAAFARNKDAVFVETNIRTAVIHHFFRGTQAVHDKEIAAVLARALPRGRAREGYAALMDYGSHLKRSGVKLNRRAKSYAKQSAFEGSYRQARGAILRALLTGPAKGDLLIGLLGAARRAQMRSALATLVKEGMVELRRGRFGLPS
jgi:A/G-specific adenine glycosylase